jgi:hypothetical protein
MNIFEQATRAKIRFSTPVGMLSVEDLWDLPLTSTQGQAGQPRRRCPPSGRRTQEHLISVLRQ